MTTRTVFGACPHDCPDTCALQVTVENERVIKVQGRAEHANTHGALCTKVSRYAERTYHPERVLHPLKRVSKKTEPPAFVQVTWAEALADIAARLKAVKDPQRIQPYSYAGTMGLLQGEAMAGRLWNALGAARLDRTICASAGGAGLALTYGHKLGMHTRHFAGAKLIVIWGSNSIASNLHFWTYANQAKRDGAKLICIDPRKTETADKCHQHIAVLPGTDGALALGVMHELIANDWLDHDYIANHLDGWDELRAKALAWPPERVAETCGITADEVRGLARDYGDRDVTKAPAAIRMNYGLQRVRGGGNAVRLVALLPCLTGAWRHPSGGALLSASGWFAPYKNAGLERPDLLAGHGHKEMPRTVNMSTIGDALLQADAPIEAIVVYNSNPVAVAPESPKVVKGFQREDLFTVVLEHFMTDTADLADYVLPATTQLEHLDVHTSYGHTDVLMNQPAIAPLGEAKPNTQIFRELAAAMGLTDPCFSETDEQLAAQAFTADIDLGLLRTQGWQSLPIPEAPFAEGGFRTPTGRANAAGADFVPNYESAASAPGLAARYPLAMISPPARNFLNSSFVNVKSLRDIEREPIIEMHAADAAARQLADGARVAAFNDRGRYVATLKVSPRARPGVVNGLGVWWRKLGLEGTNVNEVTHQRLTDMGEAPAFYDCLVQVEAA